MHYIFSLIKLQRINKSKYITLSTLEVLIVARLGVFLPNWASFEHVGLEKTALGVLLKFELLFTTFSGFIKCL